MSQLSLKLASSVWALCLVSCWVLAAPSSEKSHSIATNPSKINTDSKIPPTGARFCYGAFDQSGNVTPLDCATEVAISLSKKQDGMPNVVTSSFAYSTVGRYAKTDCVADKITGLIWEGKHNTGKTPLEVAFHDHEGFKNYPYFKFGYWKGNVPTPGTRGNTDAYSYYGDGRRGDAIAYVAEVNAMKLCGYSDWRLPTVNELHGLVTLGKKRGGVRRAENSPREALPLIDIDWFPNTISGVYLSAEPLNQQRMWCVGFDSGYVLGCRREMSSSSAEPLFVRLVRDTLPVDEHFERYRYLTDEQGIAGGIVKDQQTNLLWRRCEEPLVWNGHHCTGPIKRYTYHEALQYSNRVQGWRLPNIKELTSIFERDFKDNHLNLTAFPLNEHQNHPYYWSSTACTTGDANTFAGGWALGAGGDSYCDSLRMRFALRLVHE
jgi:hypothetical protein